MHVRHWMHVARSHRVRESFKWKDIDTAHQPRHWVLARKWPSTLQEITMIRWKRTLASVSVFFTGMDSFKIPFTGIDSVKVPFTGMDPVLVASQCILTISSSQRRNSKPTVYLCVLAALAFTCHYSPSYQGASSCGCSSRPRYWQKAIWQREGMNPPSVNCVIGWSFAKGWFWYAVNTISWSQPWKLALLVWVWWYDRMTRSRGDSGD